MKPDYGEKSWIVVLQSERDILDHCREPAQACGRTVSSRRLHLHESTVAF